jgi:Tfp pilus assembly protein PilV
MKRRHQLRRRNEGAFSLLEMLFAILILLVGLVAIAQLVPASIVSNSDNRYDSTALVYAQQRLDILLAQPITASSFADPYCGGTCFLGDPLQPNVAVGNAVVESAYHRAMIDFSAAPIDGYNVQFHDINDPNGPTLDVRWAVITTMNGPTIFAKRFVLGVRQKGGTGFTQPVTLDTSIQLGQR